MDAGALDQRIVIETPETVADELGQENLTWVSLGEFWAKAMETPGREFLAGDYRAEEKTVFIIRWQQLDSTARVRWADRIWRIESLTGTRRDHFCYLHTFAIDGPN